MRLKPLIAVVLLLFVRKAAADAGAVVVFGKGKPHDREVVAAKMTRALRDAAWSIADQPLTQPENDAIVACTKLDRPWPCVAPTAKNKNLDRIAVIQVEPDKGDKDLVLTGQILIEGDRVPSLDQDWCKKCNDATLETIVAGLAAKMIDHASARNAHATLSVRTIPPGAVITLDGTMVGSTDRTVTTTPGDHTVLLQKSGYRPETRTVKVEDAKPATIDVTLTKAEGDGDGNSNHGETHRSRLVPGIVMGVGAAALIGGAVVSFATGPPNTRDQPKYLYSVPGIAVSVAGGAAIAVGLYLWFRQPAKTSSTAVVVPTQGGGVVGWMRTF